MAQVFWLQAVYLISTPLPLPPCLVCPLFSIREQYWCVSQNRPLYSHPPCAHLANFGLSAVGSIWIPLFWQARAPRYKQRRLRGIIMSFLFFPYANELKLAPNAGHVGLDLGRGFKKSYYFVISLIPQNTKCNKVTILFQRRPTGFPAMVYLQNCFWVYRGSQEGIEEWQSDVSPCREESGPNARGKGHWLQKFALHPYAVPPKLSAF